MRIQKQKIRKLFKLDSSAFKNTIISLNIPLVMKLTDNIEERNCPIIFVFVKMIFSLRPLTAIWILKSKDDTTVNITLNLGNSKRDQIKCFGLFKRL